MLVRPHRRADADRIAEILAAGWRQAYSDFMPADILAPRIDPIRRKTEIADWLDGDFDAVNETLFVAADPQVNGFIHVELGDKAGLGAVGIVNLLYVDPPAQRRGLGRALLRKGAEWLSERATGPMALSAYRDNPFRHAYAAMGGVPVKEVVSDFGAHRLGSVLYLWTDPRRVAAAELPRGR